MLNGFTIRYLGLSPILSPGQLIRGLFIIFLLFDLFNKNKITKENKYIYMSIPFIFAALLLYIVRDGVFHQVPLEIISFTKPLFFLLLLHFVYTNQFYFVTNLDKIMKINLFIYTAAIFFSTITGVGLTAYEAFYSATKSFFYGQNVTSITGFTLCIFYSFKFREGGINFLFFSLSFLALFLSGGKIILLVPIISSFIYLYHNKRKNISSIIIKMGLLLGVIYTVFFATSLLINNQFTQRYFSRAFGEGMRKYEIRDEINIIPLKWYSYVSLGRAYRADKGINSLLLEPENLFFGYGISMRSTKVGYYYGKMAGAEMDIIDMVLDYGIIGLLLIYIPIIKALTNSFKKNAIFSIEIIAFLIFMYSSFAGHVLTTPMAGSLFALFLGVCGSEIKGNPPKPVFV